MPEPLELIGESIVKSYGDKTVIADLSLKVPAGEFAVVLGPSGCGKTTLLRCLSGLTKVNSGEVRIGGEVVRGVPKDVAVVFQEYNKSLFPWKSLEENIVFALRGMSKAAAHKKAIEALDRVGLADSADHLPWQVSGGMQQRAAIARCLAMDAGLVIMDEPFASVDALTKIHLETLLLDIWTETPFTCVFVTHDIEEAVYLADTLFVLSGRPTKLREQIVTELPRPRDQLATKRLDRFQVAREHAYSLIEGVGSKTHPVPNQEKE